MNELSALDVIRGQIVAGRAELDGYHPTTFDWFGRATATADLVVPWLCDAAADACGFCEEVYNSPDQLRAAWAAYRQGKPADPAFEAIDFHLGREQVLLKEIAGDVVSRVLTDYLLADGSGRRLAANGRSDYPDLYVADRDYSELPKHTRQRDADESTWAALKGTPARPVRVPDGVEIKTCRNTFRVDCHYPHAGLHVALFYTERRGRAAVTDLLAAFLVRADYRASNVNTGATTTKHSFGPTRFVSLRHPGAAVGVVR